MSTHGLGKGLDALFSDISELNDSGSPTMIPLSEIEPNAAQPRKSFDKEALLELSESIRQHGLLQPIAVRKLTEGHYQIIAGERRWRAAREAGLEEVPVHLVEADDRTAMELALVENLQRQDLNPIEEAQGYQTLLKEYQLTQEQVADRVGRSRPAVANSLRLLSLCKAVLELVSDGKLSSGHAKPLLALPAAQQERVAKLILEQGLSVRQTENLVKKLLQAEKPKKKAKEFSVNYLEEIERSLSTRLGRKVTVVSGRKKGRIELEYYDNKDLDVLIDLLGRLGK